MKGNLQIKGDSATYCMTKLGLFAFRSVLLLLITKHIMYLSFSRIVLIQPGHNNKQIDQVIKLQTLHNLSSKKEGRRKKTVEVINLARNRNDRQSAKSRWAPNHPRSPTKARPFQKTGLVDTLTIKRQGQCCNLG